VSRCAYVATTINAHSQALQAFTAGGHLSADGVYVETKNQGGGLTDGPFNPHTVYIETKNPAGGLQPTVPFHLAVICPSARNVRVAVVAASGLINLGSSLTSSFQSATGQYYLVTNTSLSACATIATCGSVSKAVPFDPATVEITPGLSGNSIGIQVRQLLFFGGNAANEAFHAAMVC
jgi:hypothetical protein